MELWIRSQDREHLIKTTDIDLDCDDKRAILINNYHMGVYKSKERALEVLDEIQDLFIKQHISESTINKDGIVFNTEQLNSIVYEMPKE